MNVNDKMVNAIHRHKYYTDGVTEVLQTCGSTCIIKFNNNIIGVIEYDYYPFHKVSLSLNGQKDPIIISRINAILKSYLGGQITCIDDTITYHQDQDSNYAIIGLYLNKKLKDY